VVQASVDLIRTAGLAVEAIDITELALRNLVSVDATEDRANAVVCIDRTVGLIEVVRNGELFFSRRLGLQSQVFERPDAGDEHAIEELALEVQRSLDYFESQYGKGSVEQVRLFGTSEALNAEFDARAAAYLTAPLRGLSDDGGLQLDAGIDRQDVSRYAPAVGGALRNVVFTG
jgi:MSHA biogenesis protein MshI